MSFTRSRASFFAIVVMLALAARLTAADAAADPLRYYIGHEVVVASVTGTIKTSRQIEVVASATHDRCPIRHDADPDLCVTETTVTTREGTVVTKLVPNPRLHADISIAAKSFTDDQLTVELRDGMLLKSINVKSTGRAGDVITSIARFAGVVLGLGGIVPVPAKEAPPPPAPVKTTDCNPFSKPFKDLPDTARLFLWENEEQCLRWQDIAKLQKARDARVNDRIEIERQIRGATGPELKQLLDKLKTIADAIDTADEDLKKRLGTFGAALDVFVATLKLGTVTTTSHHDQVLKLEDLPPSKDFRPGMSELSVNEKIKSWSDVAQELWRQARTIVTLDPVVELKCSPEATVPGDGVPSDDKVVQIFFRQGAPARMRVLIADQADDSKEAKLRSVADRFDNFVHPCLPVSSMMFKRSAWADREITLTFDEKGRPVKLDRISKSDAAAIAASLSTAATTFRDELAATVSKSAEILTNRRKLELDNLTTKLERLKLEKDGLDAQLALDASGANFDAALKQKQAGAAMQQLEAEMALAAAQANADQKQQIDALKVSVEQIKQQIELVKAQQELDKLKK